MKLFVVIETSCSTEVSSAPFCSDSYDAALQKAKEFALSQWVKRANQEGVFPWMSDMLDDLMDSKRQCRVGTSFGEFSLAFIPFSNGIRLLENDRGVMDWTVREIETVQLGNATMADITDAYDYELVRTSVLYSLRDRYPGLDETPKSVQELIDNLTHRARKDIDEGCDEDWSIDEAFRAMVEEVRQVCEAEY